jgi:hypothetical protein
VHSATGYTPSYPNLGRELKLPTLLDSSEKTLDLDPTLPREWADRIFTLREVYLLVKNNLEEAYKKARHHYNLRHRHPSFKIKDLVLCKNYALNSATRNVTAGLLPKFLGPYTIKNRISSVIYELECKNGKTLGNWHDKELKLYYPRS